MKVKYKVVKRRTRVSAMINGNSKYARRYFDGNDVYAHGNTIGILVFETLSAADQWAAAWETPSYTHYGKELIILKVLPIGRGKRVEFLAPEIDTETLDRFYSGNEDLRLGEAPDRTMAYPGVHVLGEYEWA
jgi:hypothetical protein